MNINEEEEVQMSSGETMDKRENEEIEDDMRVENLKSSTAEEPREDERGLMVKGDFVLSLEGILVIKFFLNCVFSKTHGAFKITHNIFISFPVFHVLRVEYLC